MTVSKAIKRGDRNFGQKAAYLCASLFVATALAQAPGSPAPPVLTVCEALRDIGLYAGKDVVIVGYSGWTFEGSFIHEKCEPDNRIVIQGHRWLSMMELSRTAPPAKATEPFPVEESVLRIKLSHLSDYKSAELKASQEQPELRGAIRLSLSGAWVAAYGRIQSPSKLEEPVPPAPSNPRNIPGNGYGANGSVPARLLVIKSISVPPLASGLVP
jgi:hypothetical protein